MINRRLGHFDKLPAGVKNSDFSVWQTPVQYMIMQWRNARHQPDRVRLREWGQIMTAGEHYFNRGVFRRCAYLPLGGYLTMEPWSTGLRTMWWKSQAAVYLNTVPDGYHFVLKDRLGVHNLDYHHMLWWEELYDACDVLAAGAVGWWWPFLSNERGGIVCVNENDAVLAAAEITSD